MTFAGNPQQQIGTIDKILEASIVDRVDNDGDHQYLHIQEECKNQLPLTVETKQMIIPLTNPNVDVVQFDKSFITLSVRVMFSLATGVNIYDYTTATDPNLKALMEAVYKGCQIMIGYKNSTDCIESRSVYHNGKLITGTLQDHASQESFIYHSYRSEEELMKRKGIYSIAEAVDENDESSVCGTFVSLYDLLMAQKNSNRKFEVTFNLTIPFNDNLIFEDFCEYPNALFGTLEFYFRFNKDSLVYKQCEPVEGIKNYIRKNEALYNAAFENLGKVVNAISPFVSYNHEYEQIGDSTTMINKIAITEADGVMKTEITSADFIITPLSISIDSCYSTIVGYKMRPDVLEMQRVKYSQHPWVRFSQNVTMMPFSQSVNTSGLAITQQTYLNNVTDFVLTFPRTDRQITVSKNPMLAELSLGTMGRKYPEQPLDTSNERFAEIMLNSSDVFDGAPRKEYVNSISIPRATIDGKIKPIQDLSSFLLTLKVERPSAMGLIFDGLDSGGKSVSVRLDAKHKYTGANDDYGNSNLPPPVLYTCNDSFFIFNSRDGGQCVYSDRDFNTICPAFMSGAYGA